MQQQDDLFASKDLRLTNIWFDGETYSYRADRGRLKSLLERVFAYMKDGRWRTLSQIQGACGGSEASVSARLRDFRKPRFGGFDVQRKRTEHGLWHYRLKGSQ